MLEGSFRHAFLLYGFLLEQWKELLEDMSGILEEMVMLLELRLTLELHGGFFSLNRVEKHSV